MKRTTRAYVTIPKLRIKRQHDEKESSNIIPKAHRTKIQMHNVEKTSMEVLADFNNTITSEQQDSPVSTNQENDDQLTTGYISLEEWTDEVCLYLTFQKLLIYLHNFYYNCKRSS